MIEGSASPKEGVVSKGDLVKSIVASLRQGQLEDAASLYRRSTEDIGYEVMNQVGRGELAQPLATVLLQVRDFYKAAQVLESIDMKREAAENYEKAAAWEPAAELFASIGDLAASAEMFERGGAYSRAAPLFSQAERWLDAGRCHAKAEEYFLAGRAFVRGADEKKALECLQKVGADDPSYAEAVDLLGPILEKMGFPEIATDRYRGIVSGQGVTPENVGVFYRIARIQESSNRIDEALQTYSQILEVDMGHEDVVQRYRALKDRPRVRAGAAPTPAPATNAPSAGGGLVVLDEHTSLFEKSVLFQDLSLEEMRAFLALAERKAFKAGEPLLLEGRPVPGLGLLRQGTVGVGMKLEGKNVKLRSFGPGDHFGEITVLGAKDARVTAIAETAGDYVFVPGDRMRRLLDGYPTLAVKLLRNMMAAMDVHLDQYSEIVRAVWRRGGAS